MWVTRALIVVTLCTYGYPTWGYVVRVLIDEWSVSAPETGPIALELAPTDHSAWSLDVPGKTGSPLYTFPGTACSLVLTGSTLHINDKRVKVPAVYMTCASGRWRYKDHVYAGDMLLVYQDERWLLINRVDLETYVWGVIRWESWPGWPLEMNKVCAILARTYAVHRIMQEQKRHKKGLASWFDVRATNAHQTYRGIPEYEPLRAAVDETARLVITYEGKPIIAMYDACCGGVAPALVTGFNFDQCPYLARTYACTFCQSCKAHAWDIAYTKKLFVQVMHQVVPDLKDIQSICDAQYDPAGKLLQLVLVDKKGGRHAVTGEQMYAACKDIKSFCYEVTLHKDTVRIAGKGLGHHMGLCQWGARHMVKLHHTVRSIIQYYYPGTLLMRLADQDIHALV